MQPLTDQELYRYNRQITLKGFDIDKQEQLKNSSALIIGLGGLGCSTALYLTSSGIGKLTLNDFDTVSSSNLHRQILYTDNSVDQFKVTEAKRILLQHNPAIQIETIASMLDDDALSMQIAKHDIVLDCSDNKETRLRLNQYCFQHKTPLISGAAIRMEALISTFIYEQNQPCYHCLSQLFGQDQLTCVEAGVMAPLVGIVGSLQALEAIKVLTHYGVPLTNRLLMIDAMTMQFNDIILPKRSDCPVCQHG